MDIFSNMYNSRGNSKMNPTVSFTNLKNHQYFVIHVFLSILQVGR